MRAEPPASGDPVAGALRPSLWLLALTSAHHAYGALAFATPWRWHVVPAAVIAAGILIAAALARRAKGRAAQIAMAVFVLIDLLFPGVGIGLFEGLYNHVLKNVLYFGGGSARLMTALFPPPAYEWPHDVFFEASGIAQGLLGILVLWRWYVLVRAETRRGRLAATHPG